jgi:hypothetical protein
MKRITCWSLALIIFSLFSTSYFVTSATAQTSTTPAGTSGMPPTGMAATGTPGMPPTDMAPTGTPESGGISDWIKGGLKSLGIGTGTDDMPPKADTSAAPIGEGGVVGGPAAKDMSGNMINDGGHGANSADEEAKRIADGVAKGTHDSNGDLCKSEGGSSSSC